jgi:16S rRNA (guanine527-N7)-methyltransferase
MDVTRIAKLLAPFLGDAGASGAAVLSPTQLRYISIYIDLLLHWNARMNLTAVREPEEIVTRHFGESIFAARLLFPGANAGTKPGEPDSSLASRPHVIDVGSGAGFPGLPVKIWAPHVHLTLIESSQRKATFLREVVRSLRLSDAGVFMGRANAFPGPKGDIVTLRAVEHFETILPVAADLVGPVGRLAMLIGVAQVVVVCARLSVMKWSEPVKVPLSNKRVLIIGSEESGSLTR